MYRIFFMVGKGYAPPTDSSNYRSAKLMSIARCAELSVLRLAICYNLRGNDPIQVGKFCQKLIELNLYRFLILALLR
ncbi:hypothetical protein Scep_022332 [Stephania cephalantha]|uniref:Uncharacterized protein n=1 Tax=Stephania cephalantha TaxID=152367 RepID=A0AAP0FEN4_9MAGN